MHYLTSAMKNYSLYATDGEMGKIQDLYFDDEKWGIRYAVVDSRKWLPGKRILLSPASFETIEAEKGFVKAYENKDTIRNSPDVPEGQPITKEVEQSLSGYYGWNRYWTDSLIAGMQQRPYNEVRDVAMAKDKAEPGVNPNQEHNLRSSDETMGYKVHASNGKLGYTADFMFDDHYWKMRYMVVQGEGLENEDRYYLVALQDVESVDWLEGDIYVKGSLESLKSKKSYSGKSEILADM
ncbi:PRC-barrel domain-containing protein [Virgibacillus siamensis]|uniref:PRC-barrel domain-containing protein n=1 Tax=Virgibacillus siamensis TaxID=480071 RepID=UPI00098490D4|nr:PRC-barrel domain-containing protein [Virgibacillus siamensis]